MSIDLDSFVTVPLSNSLYAEMARRFPGRVSSTLEQVVCDFLDRTADMQPRPVKSGYQWDALFLPDGTQVRTKYFGEHKVACVAEGAVLWENQAYTSMSQLARAMRGNTSNNAWKVLEVMRPTDGKWQSADFLRR